MRDKTNIEDINILNEMKHQLQVRNKQIENDIYDNEIFASQYEERNEQIRAIENILADRERLIEENRALREDYQTENQYYEEKIKDKIEELKEEKYILSSRDAEIMLLQELLDT